MRFLIALLLFCGCTRISPNESYYNEFELPPSIYGEHITILISPPEDVAKLDTSIDFKQLNGITMTDGGNILIWFPFLPSTDEKWSVVHHELFHATYSVMDWVNIPLSPRIVKKLMHISLDILLTNFIRK